MFTALLKTIRPLNLLMIALSQVLAWLFVMAAAFAILRSPVVLGPVEVLLIVLGTVLIAAGGYLQNDMNDIATDAVNKPGKNKIGEAISVKQAGRISMGLFVVGLLLGLAADLRIGSKPVAVNTMLISVVLLFLYNRYLQRKPFIGNLVTALLAALTLVILGMVETFNIPEFNPVNSQAIKYMWAGLGGYAAFAFMTNLIREVVKDIQDMQGDRIQHYKTLPIVLREKGAKYVVIILLLILIRLMLVAQMPYLKQQMWLLPTVWAAIVQIPAIILAVLVWRAQTPKQYGLVSTLLKVMMLLGVFTMVIYKVAL